MHTGARLKELSQLYSDNIEIINDILCIHIRPLKPDQQFESRSSTRAIPIHSALTVGLQEHVAALKEQGEVRLFPDILFHKQNSYAGTPSKWWGKYKTKILGAQGKGLSFHSFRHIVANEPKQSGIEEKYIAALLGHSFGLITHNRYSKDYEPEKPQATVERLNWKLLCPS